MQNIVIINKEQFSPPFYFSLQSYYIMIRTPPTFHLLNTHSLKI